MRALDIGSVLCTEARAPLGRVEDIFGPVVRPLYALRCDLSANNAAGVGPGTAVFAPAQLAVYVDPQSVHRIVRRPLSPGGAFVWQHIRMATRSCVFIKWPEAIVGR